jgi:hypothetical protein
MTADGDTCQRCSDAKKECIWPQKRGAACVGCREAKKKCQVAPDDANTRKAEKREIAPLPKRALKKSATVVGGIWERRVTPPESSASESLNEREVVVVKPRLPRQVTSREVTTAPPRATKRKRVEEGEGQERNARSRSEKSGRRRGTQGRKRVLVVEEDIPVGGGSRSGEAANILLSLENRLARMEDTQSRIEEVVMMMNERLTATLASVQAVEELVNWMGRRFDSDEGEEDEDTEDEDTEG